MQQKKLQIEYCLLQSFYWMLFCVGIGYMNAYLTGVGLSTGIIGVITALFGAISAGVQPALGRLADRNLKLGWRPQMEIMLFICLTCNIILLLTKNQIVSGLIYGIILFLINAMLPFVSGAAFYYEKHGHALNFGFARGFGSMFYAIISFFLGRWIAQFGVNSIAISGIVVTIMLFLILCIMPYDRQEQGHTEVVMDGREVETRKSFIKEYPEFIGMLIGFMFLLIFHNITQTYMLQIVQNAGGGSPEMGTVFSIAATVEIPVLFGFSYIAKRIKSDKLLFVSGIAFAIKGIMYLTASSVAMIYAAQFFQIFSYALFAAASVYYANEKMDEKNKLRGQSLVSSAVTFGGVFGNLLGGVLIEACGMKVNLLIALIFAFAGAIVIFFMGDKKK